MSGVIVRSTSVAANSVDENVLSGSAYEFARGNSFVSMGIVQAATGLFVTIQAGGNVVAEEFEPPIEATAFPQTNEDFYFNTFAVTGDRLVIRVRNSTGGALVIRTVVQITDV
jgi:hypothetical protein